VSRRILVRDLIQGGLHTQRTHLTFPVQKSSCEGVIQSEKPGLRSLQNSSHLYHRRSSRLWTHQRCYKTLRLWARTVAPSVQWSPAQAHRLEYAEPPKGSNTQATNARSSVLSGLCHAASVIQGIAFALAGAGTAEALIWVGQCEATMLSTCCRKISYSAWWRPTSPRNSSTSLRRAKRLASDLRRSLAHLVHPSDI